MCIQVLLDNHASAHLTNSGGLTASHIALQRGDTALATGIYDIAICSAIIAFNVDHVIALVGVGGDPNVQCTHNHNFTPLILAAKVGSLAATNILLEYGADPNLSEADSWTPLMFASVRDKVSIVDRLLRAGADVLAVNKRGQCVLDLARLTGREDILTSLQTAVEVASPHRLSGSSSSGGLSIHSHHSLHQGLGTHSTDGTLLSALPSSLNLRATRARATRSLQDNTTPIFTTRHSTSMSSSYHAASVRGRENFQEHYHSNDQRSWGISTPAGRQSAHPLSYPSVGVEWKTSSAEAAAIAKALRVDELRNGGRGTVRDEGEGDGYSLESHEDEEVPLRAPSSLLHQLMRWLW